MSRLTFFLVLYFCTAALFPQNITNTLGSSGLFIIKDASNSYLTLDQSTGYLSLNNSLKLLNTTSSNIGVVYKGTDRFIHNFGVQNTFVGVNSGNFTMTGSGNIALGNMSLNKNTSGYDNTALGYLSLFSNTSGIWNTAVGYGSLYSNIDGSYNTALGYLSLQTNSSGSNNTALGYGALYVNTAGSSNTALGNWSLSANINGSFNTSLGFESTYSNTAGTNNTASGYQSLYFNTSGSYNTASGYRALYFNTIGESNTAFGDGAGYNITSGGALTCLGHSAGSTITTGGNLTCIGAYAQPSSEAATNQITLGNGNITSLRCAVTNITSLSDARDKKNIKDLNLGLDFLMTIKPRLYNWDKREWYADNKSDGSKMQEKPTAGFIAQELDEAQTNGKAEWLNLVLKDNPEKWEASPGNLLPVIVKSIQDLKKENDKLKTDNIKLMAQLKDVSGLKDEIVEFKKLKEELSEQVRILKANNKSEDNKFTSSANQETIK